MQFAKFAGEDGKQVSINPRLVTTIRQLNDKLTVVQCGSDGVSIPLPINVVVSDLEAALNK